MVFSPGCLRGGVNNERCWAPSWQSSHGRLPARPAIAYMSGSELHQETCSTWPSLPQRNAASRPKSAACSISSPIRSTATRRIFLRELISNASDACDRLRYAGADPARAGRRRRRLPRHPDGRQGRPHPDHRRQRHRHEPRRAGRESRHHRPLRHRRLHEADDRRREQGHGADRPVRRRLLFRLHGRRPGRGDEPQGRRERGLALGIRRQGRVHDRRRPTRGRAARRITLHLRQGEDDFLEPTRLRQIVRKYSDHIALPIVLLRRRQGRDDQHAPRRCGRGRRSEITPEQYKEFYHHVAHAFDEPWLTLHWRAEGKIEYTGLLFVPVGASRSTCSIRTASTA